MKHQDKLWEQKLFVNKNWTKAWIQVIASKTKRGRRRRPCWAQWRSFYTISWWISHKWNLNSHEWILISQIWNSISCAWILFHFFENGFPTHATPFPAYANRFPTYAIQFLVYANGFPTYVNHFPTYEIGYPITEIELPFDEVIFPTNETDSKNMNSEITWMQLNSKRIKFDFTIIYYFTCKAYLFI